MKKLRGLNLAHVLPSLLIIGGLVGLTASFALTYDKLQVLKDPNYQPSCNINPIFSCGSVMQTEQANLLGVPNTIFGLMAFTALITFGVLLLAGAQPKRWVWQAAQAAATLGVLFMHYLLFQSAFRIMAICIWCFVTWMVTIPIFWYITVHNIRAGNLPLRGRPRQAAQWLAHHHGDVLVVWYAAIFVVLLVQFWYYWSTLL